jgi:hypothetical protein
MVVKNNRIRLDVIMLMIGSLLLSMPSFAQVYATVSKNRVTQNELFRLTIVADQKVSGDSLDLSMLDSDFQTLGRPSFGTSINIVNGSRSTRSEWNVNIAAKRTGNITIPAFTIAGEQSQPITLQVVNDSAAPDSQDLVQINTYFDDMTLYPNQSTVMHVELIINADTRRLQDPQITPPSAEGVQLESASEPVQNQQIINGVQSTVVKQDFRITGLNPGRFNVIEPKFESQLIYTGYNGATRMIALKTHAKSFTLTVLDKPSQYTGVWLPTSYLNLEQQWQDSAGKPLSESNNTIAVGDPITRLIALTVRGVSQEQIPTINIDYPDSLRVYNEKPSYQALANGDIQMSLKQVLIANQSGDITLPGVTVKWWDTTAKTERKSLLAENTISVSAQPQSNLAPTLVQPQPTQTDLVTDSGYWPYITGLFALLWLGTFAWFQRHRFTPHKKLEDSVESQGNSFKALQQAIAEHDGFKVNLMLQRWLHESALSTEQQQRVEHAKQQWLAQHYATQATEGDNQALLATLHAINKVMEKPDAKKNSVLAKL